MFWLYGHIMGKMSVLQPTLQLNFWITEDTYNSLYLYAVSANEQVACCNSLYIWCNSLQLNCNSVKTIHFQLHPCVMLTSLNVIRLLKFNMWHYEDFWIVFFQNINFYRPLWLLMMARDYDTWHNQKLPHCTLIVFWKKIKINKIILVTR